MMLLKINFIFNRIKKPIGYLFGDILNKAIPFVILPIVANYISINKYGIYSTEVIIYSFFCNLLCMGLPAKIILDIVKDKKNTEDVSSNVIASFFIFSICMFIVIFTVNDFFIKYDFNLVTIFFCAFIQSYVNIFITKYQANNNVKSFVLINIAYTASYFVALLYSLYSNLWVNVWLNILFSYLILSLVLIIRSYLYSESKFNKKYITINKIKDSFKFGLYQLPHVLSSWVRLGYDRLILAGLLSMGAVGGYSAALQVSLISSVIFQSLNKFWTPFFIRKLDEEVNVKKIIILGCCIIVVITFLNVIFGYFYFELFLPTEYMSFYNIVPIICASYMFQGFYFLIVNYIYHFNCNKLISIPSVSSIVIHIIIAPFLIKCLGYNGAAISLLVSWFILFTSTLILIDYIKRNYDE